MVKQIKNIDLTEAEVPTKKGTKEPPSGRKGKQASSTASTPSLDRSSISSKVGSDSLSGWVKKNIGQIEVTEGRL